VLRVKKKVFAWIFMGKKSTYINIFRFGVGPGMVSGSIQVDEIILF